MAALVRAVVLAALVLVPSAVVGSPAHATPVQGEPVVYEPPVDAPVVDPFRPPGHRYGAGNRGLTYDLASGTPVRTAAEGTVSFVGPVAGTLHVTVAHPDGLRTSYSFLDSVAVRRGQVVAAGDVVGTGGAGFHFGVRDGDTYLDPAALFGTVEVRVRLIPHDVPAPSVADVARDRRALLDIVRIRDVAGWAADRFADGVDATTGVGRAAVSRLQQRLLSQLHTVGSLTAPVAIGRAGIDLYERLRQECTPSDMGVAPPPIDARVAVTVAGYGSSAASAAIDDLDTDTLGYEPGAVVRYSYLGGRAPGDVAHDISDIPVSDYRPTDTFDDLYRRGEALADLIEDVADRRPGVPVDVYAHSQGGIVTRLALQELERRGRLDVLGVVVTIGTPHGGADLATAGVVLNPLEQRAIDRLAGLAGAHVDPGAASVAQMAEWSPLQLHLAASGVPDGVDFRTIGARGDLVVPGSRTTVDGAPSAIVDLVGPSAHDALPGDPATTRELALALAGAPPACQGVWNTVLDTAVPGLITGMEDLVTLGLSF